MQNAVLFLERRFRRSAVDELLIQTNVIVCGAAPAVVARHCALHKHLPAVLGLEVAEIVERMAAVDDFAVFLSDGDEAAVALWVGLGAVRALEKQRLGRRFTGESGVLI